MMTEAVYSGSCHCGAIGFHYATERRPAEWSVRACQCRFCRMHDALSTSDPQGTLQFFAEDPKALRRYRFALKTADFLLCRMCGVYIGAAIAVNECSYGIINTHALSEIPAGMAGAGAIRYDDEDRSAREGRREQRWTPVIEQPS